MRLPFIRRLIADRRANTAIIFALSLPVLVGAAGLGVETGFWYFKNRELQTAADVAAVAGAVEKRSGGSSTEVTSSATTEATEHGWIAGQGTIQVNSPPTSGAYTGNSSAVEVLLTMPATRFFSKIFSNSTVTLATRGVARHESGGDACILGLSPSSAGAVTFIGNALTFLNGCNVMSNSLASNALIVSGSADVTTPCALSAGGVSVDDGLTLTDCAEPQENMPPAIDPFDNVAEPPVPGSCVAGGLPGSNGTMTLSPGRYCGGGPLKGNKTFSPGVYVIDGFDFKINASANVTGSGVTFFLINNAPTDFNGNANITLSAPTSGPYKGILFWGDDANTSGTSKFNGTAVSKLTGAIYMPKQAVEFLGNFSGNNGCLRVIAYTVKVTGSTSMNSDCTAQGLSQIPLPGRVTLVE